MCEPYGVHMVYILATHMGCTDVYHMVVQCGIHVELIWDVYHMHYAHNMVLCVCYMG